MNTNTNKNNLKLLDRLKNDNESLLLNQPEDAQISIRTVFDVSLENCTDAEREMHKFNCLFYLDQFNYTKIDYTTLKELGPESKKAYRQAFFRILNVLKGFALDNDASALEELIKKGGERLGETQSTLLEKANNLPLEVLTPIKSLVEDHNVSPEFRAGLSLVLKGANAPSPSKMEKVAVNV